MPRPEFTPQAKIVGPTRNRLYELKHGSKTDTIGHPRRSIVIFGIDKHGDYVFIPGPQLVGLIDASLLPEIAREAAGKADRAKERGSLKSALKKKTAIPGYRQKRPSVEMKKMKGTMIPVWSQEIAIQDKESDLKKILRENGINAEMLFLLLSSAAHTETIFYKDMPRKPLPDYKKGGFRSPNEVKIMERQRRRINLMLKTGNIIKRK